MTPAKVLTPYKEGLKTARRMAVQKAWNLRKATKQTWSSELIKEQKQQALACRSLAESLKNMIKR